MYFCETEFPQARTQYCIFYEELLAKKHIVVAGNFFSVPTERSHALYSTQNRQSNLDIKTSIKPTKTEI